MGLSKSALNYKKNPASRKRKAEYAKKYNAKPENKKYRRLHAKKNYEADKRGVDRKGKHLEKSTGRYVDAKKNMGRIEKSRKKGYNNGIKHRKRIK
jgi:hypothetical protein